MKVVESVNFAYDGKTDRIHLYACFKESATVTRVELTRRFLAQFLPSVSARVADGSVAPVRAGKIAPSAAHNRATAAREHTIARQIPLRKKQLKQSQLDDQGFLALFITIKTRGEGNILLVLTNEAKDREVGLQMSVLELHRFIDQLITLAAQAEWGLPDPWATVKSASYQPGLAH